MIFRRHRFGDLVRRQLDLFEEDDVELLREAETAARAYDEAEREDAEEAYGDYQLVLESVVERLEELRDTYGATLDEDSRAAYEQAFDRGARKRFPTLTASSRNDAMKLEDYGLISDLQTAALVGRDGSIDWLCLPRFDSDSCFASLLGDEWDGRWLLAPDCEVIRAERCYREGTLVHELDFHCESGVVRVIDFMPPRGEDPDVVRIVEGVEGSVPVRMELVIRFGYGAIVPWVRRLDDDLRVAIAGPDALALRTTAPVRGENLRTVSEFTVEAGERRRSCSRGFRHITCTTGSRAIDPEAALEETCSFWREWLDELHLRGALGGTRDDAR